MDSFEVGRQRAAQLHASAVAAGCDPWRPYNLAVAEISGRDIEVGRVPPGDVRLFKARAVFDADASLILHEETGDPFTDASLIAHELGHVELEGTGESSSTSTVDMVRSSEAAPVGVDRVVDYSQRQRREVQMDLFAREFLLPRPWVRELHLNQGMSAAAIASRVGAPYAVVAQQLLDALLLPVYDAPPARAITPLNPDQKRAAECRTGPFLLEAGPGTGKTQTLVGRVDHLLSQGVAPKNILLLTYSNKAAGELAERIAAMHPRDAANIWIGTFHGFGLDVVRRFHDRLELPGNPRLLDRSDSIGMLEQEYPRLDLVHFKDLRDPLRPLASILAAISRASDEAVDAAAYRELAESMLAVAQTDKERREGARQLEVASVFAAYERLKLAQGCIDFGDLVAMPVRLCEAAPDIREHIASTYQHVLVDEYQDVNRSGVRLLQAISRGGRGLWAVGDVKQSIYRFRGASAFNISRFDQGDFTAARRGRLERNYRSDLEIVDAFSIFASQMRCVQGAASALQSHRGSGGRRPEHRSVGSAEQEIAAVAEAIEERRGEGYSYRDQAVLCSGNDRLGRVAAGLERLGVPVLYLGSLFERDEIKELLSLLMLVADPRAMGLVRVGAMARYGVPLADIALVLAHLKAHEREPLQWGEHLDEVAGLSPGGRESLERIARLLAGYEPHAIPWVVLSEILLDRTSMAADIATSTEVRVRSRGIAIWQFLNFLKDQPSGRGLPITRLLNRIRRLVLLSDERDLRQIPAAAQGIDAVRLMTMHGSKGLEFPVVHIPGLNEGSLPRSPNSSLARAILPPDGLIGGATGKALDVVRAGMIEEQECLFFVALSRARDHLLFYSPTRTANGQSRQRSTFLDRLGIHLGSRPVVPSLSLPPGIGEEAVALTIDGPVAFTDRQVSLYGRCPRRFFYSHILGVGGRRVETAFMRLHNVVQAVIDAQGPLGEASSPEALRASFDAAWASDGPPAEHGYREEYEGIAWQLLLYYASLVSGISAVPVPELRLPLAAGEIVILPDHALNAPDGVLVLRRIATGHKGSGDEEDISAAAFHLATTAHSSGSRAELVYLSDADVFPVAIPPTKLRNRRATLEETMHDIVAGRFPLNESVTCPNCPSFFVCGPLPPGPLAKRIPN